MDNAGLRESALRKRHTRAEERLAEHTTRLPPLRVGDHVRIQNQSGRDPNKWDKTGLIVEVRQHDQYVVRVDGSGRVTLRNRKFLRRFQLYKPSIHSPVATLHHPTNLPCATDRPTTSITQSHSVIRAPPLSPQAPHDRPLQRISTPARALETPRVTPATPTSRRLRLFEPPDVPSSHHAETDTTTASPRSLLTQQLIDGTEGSAPTDRVNKSPDPQHRAVRHKRVIIPPAKYDPKEWDLST
jgi:hypothetical protein